jgi:hypothetical protein
MIHNFCLCFQEQQTPLHIASRLGNVDIVVLLLQSGAQVDANTKDLYTALHIAAKEGQEEVRLLIYDYMTIPFVPGIVTLIRKNIEPIIFGCFFSFDKAIKNLKI